MHSENKVFIVSVLATGDTMAGAACNTQLELGVRSMKSFGT